MEVTEKDLNSHVTCNSLTNIIMETQEVEEIPKSTSNNKLDTEEADERAVFIENDENLSSKEKDNISEESVNLNTSGTSSRKDIKRKRLINISESESDDELQTVHNLSDKHFNHSEIVPNTHVDGNDVEENANNKKPLKIIDSDSDSEDIVNLNQKKPLRNINKNKIIDSDSDNEPDSTKDRISSINDQSKPKVIDTESESEDHVISLHNKSSRDHNVATEQSKIYTTNSKGELVLEAQVEKKSKWSALCDDESSGEENNDVIDRSCNTEEQFSEEENIKPITYKKKKSKNEKQGPKRMTPKEAAQLRKETISESQRMIRESNVSLPYHKPKSFTLKEFLSRRPKLASAVPIQVSTPPSVAIKLCAEKLDVISKKLEEREKEVRDFYKSESEPEDDNDPDYTPTENAEDSRANDGQHKIETDQELKNKEAEVRVESADTPLKESVSTSSDSMESKDSETPSTDKFDTNDMDLQREQSDTVTKENNSNPDDLERVTMDIEDVAVTSSVKDMSNKDFYTLEDDNVDERKDQNEIDLEQRVNQSSEAYEFNLDDLDDSTEDQNITAISTGANHTEKLDSTDFQPETDPDEPQEKNISAKLKILQDIELTIQPRLSGGPNDIIDLTEGVTKPNEITMLMERFEKHTRKNTIHKNKVKLNVVSVTGGQIHNETVAINVDDDETDPSTIEEKPGAKLARLRVDLQSKLAQRRSELWKQKLEKKSNNDIEVDMYAEEKTECNADEGMDTILDDDEEEEMSASSEEDEDIEAMSVEKVEKKSPFLDAEAEDVDMEDDDHDVEEDDHDVEDDDENGGQDEQDEDSDGNEPDANSNDLAASKDHNIEVSPTKKPLRRIIKGFTEDSDDEDVPLSSNTDKVMESQEDEITCHQPQRLATKTGSELEFLTPVSYITGIQNLNNSASKVSPFRAPNVPSPLKDSNWHSDLQKKLFQNSEISNTQAQAISELCSGPFSDSQEVQEAETDLPSTDSVKNSSDTSFEIPCTAPPTTQEVLDICSGGFTGVSQVTQCTDQTQNATSQEKITETGKAFTENHIINPTKELKSLDEDHGLIISQLLNEEEMENFKKKFDSPVMTNTQKRIVEEFEEDIAAAGGVIDSDDEDENLEIKKKKKQQKLHFSDDDSSDNEDDAEEEIDLHDDVEGEEEEDIPADNIGYDSEENEVELQGEPKRKFKAADFFEDEAELSESEWGSADEDEKDLDTLEVELGDEEKFDEKKIRDDLEKIHMRRMLNDDDREVKLLQELLLEDGELHGTGRERQFKWKNIDSVDNTEGENAKDEDDVYFDEEESEEQWRRRRYEREMFLKEKLEKSQKLEDEENLLGDSQLLKIGHEVLKRSQKGSAQSTEVKDKQAESPKFKSTFTLLNKRGSFLSRGEEVLQRLSVYSKVTETVVLGTAKNSRNFLFQTVSAGEETVKDKKRKATDGTPAAIKKLRLSENFSPANRKKKDKPSAKSKLLFNLTD